MSLLMDALRRAEQEKKAAAEKLKEKEGTLKGDWPNTDNLSLIPADVDDQQDDHSLPEEQPEASDNISHGHDPDATLAEVRENLDLNPEHEASVDDANAMDMQSETIVNQSNYDEIEDDYSLSLQQDDNPDADDAMAAQDETDVTASHARDSDKFTIDMSGEAGEQTLANEQDNTNDTLIVENRAPENVHNEALEYEPTLEQTRTYSESAGSTQTSEKNHDNKSSNFSPVTAQNVFAARKNNSQTAFTVVILILLIAIGLTAAGFFYYYSVTPVTRQIVSPRVAEDVPSRREGSETISPESVNPTTTEADLLPPPIAKISATDSPGIDTVTANPDSTTTQKAADMSSGNMAQDATSNVIETGNVTEQQASPESIMQAEESASVSVTEPATETVLVAESETVDQTGDVINEELELRPALVKISKSRGQSTLNETVKRAYQAYTSGELKQAQRLYIQVLESSPNNRNALLGLGAISVRLNRLDSAYHYYGDILKQNPSDRVALAALVSIQQQADPANSEARIRRLLEEEPDAAYLYQALGHVYARAQRWPQAQQAYFDAFTRDSSNADYAFNLAVSLDQLNQTVTALEYYSKALKLAENQPISFERKIAQERVARIRQAKLR